MRAAAAGTRTARWAALCLGVGTGSLASSARAETACFPACRTGYVCAPDGKCVSECNPPCADSEACRAGECFAKVATAATAAPEEPARPRHFLVATGGVFQAVGSNTHSSVFGGAVGGGFDLYGRYELFDRNRLFFGPRFQLLFYKSVVPEVGLEVGYRGRFGRGNVKAGPIAWFEPQVWFAKYPLPYFGLRVGGMVEYKALFTDLTVGGGVPLDLSGSQPQPAPSVTAGADIGLLF